MEGTERERSEGEDMGGVCLTTFKDLPTLGTLPETVLNSQLNTSKLFKQYFNNNNSACERKLNVSRITPPRTVCDTGSAVVQINSVSGRRTRRNDANSWRRLHLYAFIPFAPYLHSDKPIH